MSTAPSRQPEPPENWEAAIRLIPAEYRPWFAVGCVVRCGLWLPGWTGLRNALALLTVPPISDDATALSNAAWSQSLVYAASSGVVQSQYYAALSLGRAARARTAPESPWKEAEWSRHYASEEGQGARGKGQGKKGSSLGDTVEERLKNAIIQGRRETLIVADILSIRHDRRPRSDAMRWLALMRASIRPRR